MSALSSFRPMPWSAKRWLFKRNGGGFLFHRRGGKPVAVPHHRLIPIDMSRYPGDALRLIRARKVNVRGEAQR